MNAESCDQISVAPPSKAVSAICKSNTRSFQWTGQLYDTRRIHPDVVVHPGPTYLTGGKDNILEEAVKRSR
jgi:hypothetical protein